MPDTFYLRSSENPVNGCEGTGGADEVAATDFAVLA
jgi:hypothetical protein